MLLPLPTLLICCLLLISPLYVRAQEENAQVVSAGKHYVELKTKALEKYNSRLERQQKKLLKKLTRKEKHFATHLKNTDSAAYVRYQEQDLSYDSISKLSHADSATIEAKTAKRKNPTIDSLKGIENFVKSKEPNEPGVPSVPGGNNPELSRLKSQLNYKTYINELITQRTNNLKNLASSGNSVPGLTGIQKQVFYGKAKMKVFKDMEDDPTKAEDKAMEYLQGTDGFDKSVGAATGAGTGSMPGNASSSDMEKMGYQTKQQMQQKLTQQFGGNLGGVAKNVGGQITQYQDQLKGLKQDIANAKQAKQSVMQVRHTDKPSFKVNPMRGLPFWKHIEKQYNWQTSRSTADVPAMLSLSAMAGFKQTPKLTYGVGIASSFGLGQSWQNLHFSFQGVGYRSYFTWQWKYGIGAYVGYERMYKQAVFVKSNAPTGTDITPTPHNTNNYNESILVGLTKSYKINTKYNGQIQVLYDVWWQQKGLQSPILLRFATTTK